MPQTAQNDDDIHGTPLFQLYITIKCAYGTHNIHIYLPSSGWVWYFHEFGLAGDPQGHFGPAPPQFFEKIKKMTFSHLITYKWRH